MRKMLKQSAKRALKVLVVVVFVALMYFGFYFEALGWLGIVTGYATIVAANKSDKAAEEIYGYRE